MKDNMKSLVRVTIVALLLIAAYSVLAQEPVKEPTLAQLKMQVAQQQVTIEEQNAEILKLQALLITAYQKQSDMTLAQAKAKLESERAAQTPKEQPKK
ncbi:MAG: hypothetical protein WAN50_00205 [Minisyncoccia bacterium]